MQTFLPYPSFQDSAICLDNKRLGKQRVEAYQILNCLQGLSLGWRNHPAVKMWRGYENALSCYGRAICSEWIKRGFNDTLLSKFSSSGTFQDPYWLGNEQFHLSHQSNLVRKLPEHYGKYFPNVPDNLAYIWPK
jgi:hypothetical protein